MIKHIKKRKKQRLNLSNLSRFVFVLGVVFYLLSAIFLRTYNVHLAVEKQDIQSQIAQLTRDNENLVAEIQTLSSKERVMSIALENGMTVNQNNIVLINSGE